MPYSLDHSQALPFAYPSVQFAALTPLPSRTLNSPISFNLFSFSADVDGSAASGSTTAPRCAAASSRSPISRNSPQFAAASSPGPLLKTSPEKRGRKRLRGTLADGLIEEKEIKTTTMTETERQGYTGGLHLATKQAPHRLTLLISACLTVASENVYSIGLMDEFTGNTKMAMTT